MGSRPYPTRRSGRDDSDARSEEDCSECMAEKLLADDPAIGTLNSLLTVP
jgi:hypothetical protein